MNEILQKLYDLFHAEVTWETIHGAAADGTAARVHYARANAYTNARDAVMRAAGWSLLPADDERETAQ